jgi:hypothetical protein
MEDKLIEEEVVEKGCLGILIILWVILLILYIGYKLLIEILNF